MNDQDLDTESQPEDNVLTTLRASAAGVERYLDSLETPKKPLQQQMNVSLSESHVGIAPRYIQLENARFSPEAFPPDRFDSPVGSCASHLTFSRSQSDDEQDKHLNERKSPRRLRDRGAIKKPRRKYNDDDEAVAERRRKNLEAQKKHRKKKEQEEKDFKEKQIQEEQLRKNELSNLKNKVVELEKQLFYQREQAMNLDRERLKEIGRLQRQLQEQQVQAANNLLTHPSQGIVEEDDNAFNFLRTSMEGIGISD